IITGAPVEHLEFEEVDYWNELCQIMDWSKTNVHSTFHICWGAQAGLYYHYGIKKRPLEKKIFGVYNHKILTPKSRLFRGFDQVFMAPHSRHTEILQEDIIKNPHLKIMSVSDEAGVYIVGNEESTQFFVMGHSEYNNDTLAKEYFRDAHKGLKIDVPKNYFPQDDPSKQPVLSWRAHSSLLYSNWLNYFVYQTTPYDLENSEKIR
ncbi:MAG: homoserine O-succinyltransferase, partial [Oscillospiraceae bacterium]